MLCDLQGAYHRNAPVRRTSLSQLVRYLQYEQQQTDDEASEPALVAVSSDGITDGLLLISPDQLYPDFQHIQLQVRRF